ncbi:MAG: hypothetical protein HQK87_04825 [Nitrospinae bacterium]|nr:hypothetical protein [Nitrospinota bacterium]
MPPVQLRKAKGKKVEHRRRHQPGGPVAGHVRHPEPAGHPRQAEREENQNVVGQLVGDEGEGNGQQRQREQVGGGHRPVKVGGEFVGVDKPGGLPEQGLLEKGEVIKGLQMVANEKRRHRVARIGTVAEGDAAGQVKGQGPRVEDPGDGKEKEDLQSAHGSAPERIRRPGHWHCSGAVV